MQHNPPKPPCPSVVHEEAKMSEQATLENARSEARAGLHDANGKLNCLLEEFGDQLAEREGYKDLDGIEAVWFYLIHKFGWTPGTVKAMKYEDIRLVLYQEMSDMKG